MTNCAVLFWQWFLICTVNMTTAVQIGVDFSNPKKLMSHRNCRIQSICQMHAMKKDLEVILSSLSDSADKLSNLGSTKANEILNNTIASKAPKSIFYSGSESNDYSVAAVVAKKKNRGY